MIKAYLKFLFVIYRFYTALLHEKDVPFFYTGALSSTIICFLFFSGFCWWSYIQGSGIPLNTFEVIFIMLAIGFLNHLVFIRPKRFLKLGFELKNRQMIAVAIFIVCLVIETVIVLNLIHDQDAAF